MGALHTLTSFILNRANIVPYRSAKNLAISLVVFSGVISTLSHPIA